METQISLLRNGTGLELPKTLRLVIVQYLFQGAEEIASHEDVTT